MPILTWKKAAKRLRRLFAMEIRGSKWLRDQLVAMAELRRVEKDWERRQDGNRVPGSTL